MFSHIVTVFIYSTVLGKRRRGERFIYLLSLIICHTVLALCLTMTTTTVMINTRSATRQQTTVNYHIVIKRKDLDGNPGKQRSDYNLFWFNSIYKFNPNIYNTTRINAILIWIWMGIRMGIRIRIRIEYEWLHWRQWWW